MAGIYWNQTEGIISLSSDGETWTTIADKNLGATQVYNNGDTLSEANAGKYYQWGNNYGFPFTGATNNYGSQIDASNYGPGNYYSSGLFVGYSTGNWDSSYNHNLWGGDIGTNEAMQGPSPTGYHIPTKDERVELYGILINTFNLANNASTMAVYLKMPMSGYQDYAPFRVSDQGSFGGYWSSIWKDMSYTYALTFNSSSITPDANQIRGRGWSLRSFKNDAEVPYANEGWTKLYGDDLPSRPQPPKLKWLKRKNNYYYFDKSNPPKHASSVTLNETSIFLNEAGQTYQLTATVSPSDAVEKNVYWSSSDTTVATVSNTGLVTCVTPGSCTITATCDGASTTCSVGLPKSADFLLVAGGGAGGTYFGGGGGAGGIIICCGYELSELSYAVSIGAGGTNVTGGRYQGGNGGDSCFGEIIAYGGGGGGTESSQYSPTNGSNGGSGGGGGANTGSTSSYGGNGCLGQGCSGGQGNWNAGGGGGGAGAVGGNYKYYCNGGDGGAGLENDFSGISQYYAGGGGGSGYSCRGAGGLGGGGDGTSGLNQSCNATYYGGGGGGSYYLTNNQKGGNGYQGIFILRYPTACGYDITGGTKYTCGSYTIHCFTSNGTLTVN